MYTTLSIPSEVNMSPKYPWILLLLIALTSSLVSAGEVSVRKAVFERKEPGLWRVSATLKHADEGFKHYSDRWRIVDDEDKQYGIRVLQHPHDLEQPFTRSLTNVAIPKDIKIVYVEARNNQHGWSKQRLKINL